MQMETRAARLVVEDDVEEGTVHVHLTVVVNEAKFPELIHEETDAGTRRPNHLGERFLTDLCNHRLWLTFLAEVCQQQQHSREPLLT